MSYQRGVLPLGHFQEREHGVQVRSHVHRVVRLLLSCSRHALCPQIAIRVLTDNSGARRGMGKQEFLNRMADSLTAEEQVRLWLGCGCVNMNERQTGMP